MNMPFKFVVLWSDVAVWVLFLWLFVSMIRPGEIAYKIATTLYFDKLGQAITLVLCLYVLVGLLDSVHYQLAQESSVTGQMYYHNEIYSLLDYVMSPLDQAQETTYSAPFAKYAYTKAMFETEFGQYYHDYPKLNHTHATTMPVVFYVVKYIMGSLMLMMVLWGVIFFVCLAQQPLSMKAYIKNLLNDDGMRYHLVFISYLSLMFVFVVLLYGLSRHFHVFGTDKVGQDVFFQAIKSIRTGLLIGTLTLFIILPLSVCLGTLAGYFGRRIDDVIQYIYTTISSVPGILLISASILAIQIYVDNHPAMFPLLEERGDLRLLMLCLVLGLTGWTGLCRLIRAETLKIKAYDFITAAKVMGVSHLKIISRHVVPNLRHIVVISLALDFSALVLAEAVLSYVGVGVDATTYSWGNMIHAARMELAREPIIWWRIVAAFSMMFVLVLSANLFADKVRDALDPRFNS